MGSLAPGGLAVILETQSGHVPHRDCSAMTGMAAKNRPASPLPAFIMASCRADVTQLGLRFGPRERQNVQ
jgi:hypothetical protein